MKSKKQNPFLLTAITFTVTAMLAAPTLHAANTDGTWLGNSGNWSDPAVSGGTWSGGIIADGAGFTAFFTGVDIVADQIITLDTPRTIGNITFTDDTTASHNLTISGDVANTLTLDVASGASIIDVTQSGRTLFISSDIAGTDGLTKNGGGVLRLAGTNNTLSGGITISAGQLRGDVIGPSLTPVSPFGANTINLNAGTLGIRGAGDAINTVETVTFGNNVVVGGNAIIDANRPNATSSNKTMAMGTLSIGAFTLNYTQGNSYVTSFTGTTLTGDATFNPSTNATTKLILGGVTGGFGLSKTGSGILTINGASDYTGNTSISAGTLDLTGSLTGGGAISTSSTGNLTQSATGVISGASTFTKVSTGTSTLAGDNSYTGDTAVNKGTLALNHNNALGTTAGDTTVESTDTGQVTLSLNAASSDLTVAENITFNSNAIARARLENTGAFNHTLSGDISVNTNTTGISVDFNSANNDGSITLSGDITGNLSNAPILLRGASTNLNNRVTGNVTLTGDNPLVKTDNGTWTLGAPGKTISVASRIQVSNGVLKMGAANVLATTTVVTMGQSGNSTGTWDLNGFDQTIASLVEAVGTTNNKKVTSTGGAAVLTVNNATDIIVGTGGGIINLQGQLGLTKTGVGKLTLGGTNSHTGDTVVSEGTLELADGAQLKFVLGDSGFNNSLTGAGTVTLDGDFVIDTTAADALSSGSWTLENVSTLTGPYGSNFSVVDFTDIGDDKWEKELSPTQKYTFDEDTGILELATTGGGFASWITQPFANGTVTNQGPNDDDDNDGIRNLVEYAIAGEDPTVPNATIGTLTGTSLSFAKRLDATGLTYAIQQSIDLGIGDDWTEVTGGTYVNDSDEISYGFTPGTPAKNFFRLQVESN